MSCKDGAREVRRWASFSSKGQLTVPADVRRHLGAQEGTRVDFVLGPEGQVTMRVVKPGLEALRGIVKPRVPVTAALIDQWAREARDHGFREE